MLLTTTIRLDPVLMHKVEFHAEQRGLPKAAFIRDATFAYIVGIETREHVVREYVEDALADHRTRIRHIELYLRRAAQRAH